LISQGIACQPPSKEYTKGEKKDIYGVLPYVAPELLKEKEYSKASDIYGFGIIMIEILSEEPPYNDQAHGTELTYKIYKGKRPQIPPRILEKLILRCIDSNPEKLPTAKGLKENFHHWIMKDHFSLLLGKNFQFEKEFFYTITIIF